VAPRHATCLDLAVVLAWACLTAELRPIIVVVEPSGAVSRTRWCWFARPRPAATQDRREVNHVEPLSSAAMRWIRTTASGPVAEAARSSSNAFTYTATSSGS
jgi:hypothetical protein